VLDLGSGDGQWLLALAARGIVASGIDASPALVARAQADAARVALGDPVAGLKRCDGASLDGISLARSVLGDDIEHAIDRLAECARVLKPGGYLLLRMERDHRRLADFGDAVTGVDQTAWNALLAAVGLALQAPLPAAGGIALLARRAAAAA
jgi:SAM-dependent methyltransferase